MKARMWHRLSDTRDKYQTDFLATNALAVSPNAPAEVTTRLYAGAKEVNLLDEYQEQFDLPLFNRAVDFGWLWFITQPLFYALDWLYGIVGNFGIAIMIITLCVKAAFFPLANKSYKAMSRMKLLQPEMTKLREQYGDDRQKMQQEMMAMYKREKVNPAAGCLPILIQIPVFFALYKVLFVSIEMRHAPFFGWIQDLSVKDPSNVFELFGLIPWNAPDFLHFGAWPLIMGATMFIQQRLNPQPADPVQAKLFLFMPLIFTVFLATFPAGLVIYWAWNNSLSILQQWIIMQRAKREADKKGGGGGQTPKANKAAKAQKS
jgi:YidC/Oxa1 family membrane protein insertase